MSAAKCNPMVSALMPVYNAERYLAAAVESILAQTFADFEFICVDDGSTDGSLDLLRTYERRDSRIRVVSRPNTGIVGALNDGLAQAQADLIARMDADDISDPQRFALQLEYLRHHTNCVIVGGQALRIDADGLPIAPWHVPLTHEEIDGAHMSGEGGMILHPSAMIRREQLLAVRGYRPEMRHVEDYDLWLRMAECGRLANLPQVLIQYRMHISSVSHRHSREQRRHSLAALADARRRRGLPMVAPTEKGGRPVQADNLALDAVTPAGDPEPSHAEGTAKTHRWYVALALDAGNAATARKHAWQALQWLPFSAKSWHSIERAYSGTWLGATVSVGIRAWERTLGRFCGGQR